MMKKIVFLCLTLGIWAMTALAQSSHCNVIHDGYDQLQVTFAASELSAHPITAEGQSFCLLDMEGTIPSQKEGWANLPTYSYLIEVPLCQGYVVEVSDAVYDTLDLSSLGCAYPVMPLQPSYSKSDTTHHPLVWDKKAYAANAYMGAELAMVEHVGIARDRNLARLQISPIQYNAAKGKLIVCREAIITVAYRNADRAATMQMFERYHSPAFKAGSALNSLYPTASSNNTPVRYLIVAHSMFHNQLDNFVDWKRRKGFLTDIVYTDNPAVGTTTTSISNYIHSQYTNANADNPAPTYVLLVGDHEQIPAYTGTTSSSHITDLYFMTWTDGDNIPDCYYGRFSAQSVSQLTPQVEKTLMYEQYTFADPSFLDRAVMVAGVDGGSSGDYGYTFADPAMDYSITHYINGANGFSNVYYFKNNTSIVPTASNVTVGSSASSNSATVRGYYNQGAGWINYSAHGSATSWGTPSFTTTHVESMTNSQKFGLMIGNCCLTNKFETTTCLGEALLRKGNYCGAVGYIGGTNSTYWYEDFYWAVGLRNSGSIGPSMSLAYDASNMGNYDAICHTHGESHNQWVETQGGLVVNGNIIVEGSTSSRKLYYWEIYQLMGDPSLMPYLTQADSITITAPNHLPVGTTSIAMQAVPYAYVALTNPTTHALIDVAYADANGMATLTLPTSLGVGSYEIAASAQQYRTTFKTLELIAPNGPFVTAQLEQEPISAGTDRWVGGWITNLGNQPANNIVVHYANDNSNITLLNDSIVIPSLAAGDTLTLDSLVHIAAATLMPDMERFTITASTTWNNAEYQPVTNNSMVCHAPLIEISYTSLPQNVMPGGHYTLNVEVANTGHEAMPATTITLHCPIWAAWITNNNETTSLASNASTTRQFTLDIDNTMPSNVDLPLEVRIGAEVNVEHANTSLITGLPVKETFEGNDFHLTGWTQGTYPWTITNSERLSGTYSARSNASLTNNQTSEMSITHTSGMDDSIRFYYKVSSEENYDKFHFYIDGTDMLTASGTVGWTRAAIPVTAGTHIFTFAYQKDYSLDRGSDCAWIDEVQLPNVTYPWRALTDTVCYGTPVVVVGNTINTTNPGSIYLTDTTSDTVFFINVTVLPQSTWDTAATACDQYIWNNTAYTRSATIIDTLINSFGCDSIVTMSLIIHYSNSDTVVVTIPEGPYEWNDETYQTSGTYTQLFENAEGCDSLVVLQLTISSEDIDLCHDGWTMKCYPNPTSGTIMFSKKVHEAIIYDPTGRVVMTLHDTLSANLQTLSDGIYTILAVLPNGNIGRLRVVVTH